MAIVDECFATKVRRPPTQSLAWLYPYDQTVSGARHPRATAMRYAFIWITTRVVIV
jgi:hypothetical protein